MRRFEPACVADNRIGCAAWGVDQARSLERRCEMKMRQMLAGFVTLAAGAMIIMPPGSSLAGSFQSSSTSNFQSASLPPTTQVPQFSSQTPSTRMVRPDYVIGPDDVISIDVFQIPDLSRTVQVDSEGNVLLPLLGAMPAAPSRSPQLTAPNMSAILK